MQEIKEHFNDNTNYNIFNGKKNCIQTQGSFEKGTQNKNERWEIKIKRITYKNKYIKGWEMKYKEFIGKKKKFFRKEHRRKYYNKELELCLRNSTS